MTLVALAIGVLGAALLVVSAIGLFRLPDALARQHAATKSTTLALALVLVAVALQAGDGGSAIRVGLTLVLLFATLPVASHLLARAAAREECSAADTGAAPLVRGEAPPGDGAADEDAAAPGERAPRVAQDVQAGDARPG